MFHACFIAIATCFIYTSYHFYAFFRTNLLTRYHSTSSCFLMSFCFRKASQGSFSESPEKLRELFLHGNKDCARRTPVGGPTGARRPPGAAQPWPHLGPTWPTREPSRVALSPINCLPPENPRYPIIFSRKHPRPAPSPTLDREGSEALPGTLQ